MTRLSHRDKPSANGADFRLRLLGEKDASSLTGLSVHWFRRKRWAGDGPPFRKIGSRCLYQAGELLDWFDQYRQVNTSTAR